MSRGLRGKDLEPSGGGCRMTRHPPPDHCPSTDVICLLSASIEEPSPRTAWRTRESQGLFGALNACWKLSATGVSPLPATSLMVTTLGSVLEYWLLARSPRETTSLPLASTPTCASSDISHDRKFHAWAEFLESFDTPMPSPPTKVDAPPSTPGSPATPTSNLVVEDRSVAGYGIRPTLPCVKPAVQ